MKNYVTSCFLAGIGGALEVYPLPIRFSVRQPSAGLTDAQRLASDWYRVGGAIRSAINDPMLENELGQLRKTPEARRTESQ